MAKQSTTSKTRIKIGGVEVVLLSERRKGKLSEASLRSAVAKGVASERATTKKS